MSEISHNREEMKFVTEVEGKEAKLGYTLNGDTINFYTTFVPPEGRGLGLARKLVDAGMAFAKQENLMVEATCSYVVKYLEKNPIQ
ncbi:MAG: N-acetyltransferase [Bdellovibrionales bacterium]|nr:N-acetyltransferase [Bdellovibrionales bacterium]NQZ18557.1 N-acetyltransferase [Bdellovibrionales bacterium]